ncbi:unnamed protein product [Amoebophrya sp. A120]|nr:unnamed protein product [Amoebophrya sp. A120]|eukprot:GSA120T00005470001.1
MNGADAENPVPQPAPAAAPPAAAPAATLEDMFKEMEMQEVLRTKERAWRKLNMRCVNAAITCFEKKQRETGEAKLQTVPEEMARKIFSFLRAEPGAPRIPSHTEQILAASEFALSVSYTDPNTGEKVLVRFSDLPRNVRFETLNAGEGWRAIAYHGFPQGAVNSQLYVADKPVPVAALRSLSVFLGQTELYTARCELLDQTRDSCRLEMFHRWSGNIRFNGAPGRKPSERNIRMQVHLEGSLKGTFPALSPAALQKLDCGDQNDRAEVLATVERFYVECERNRSDHEVHLVCGSFYVEEPFTDNDSMPHLRLHDRFLNILDLCGVPARRNN